MRTYGALREEIKTKFGTIGAFANAIGKDRSTVSQKLNGIVSWTQDEIERACELLDIQKSNIPDLFFYEK